MVSHSRHFQPQNHTTAAEIGAPMTRGPGTLRTALVEEGTGFLSSADTPEFVVPYVTAGP